MKHKWAKEIKAWADGAEIEHTHEGLTEWLPAKTPTWHSERSIFRIKQQPKEPRYLYVAKSLDGYTSCSLDPTINTGWNYIGKIKLEVDDD
jgi:hypothetical protein